MAKKLTFNEGDLVKANDKLWHKLNEELEPKGLYVQINNGTRGARALLIYKKDGEEFKRRETFVLADEFDVEVALHSMRMLLDALENKNK